MALKILLVDDDHDLRLLMSRVLSREGFETDVAENGQVAFEKIQAFPPDLVISDIRMPVCNGYELSKKLIASPRSSVPILFISGYGGVDESGANRISECKNCVGFLEKPVKSSDLLKFIKSFQEKHQTRN